MICGSRARLACEGGPAQHAAGKFGGLHILSTLQTHLLQFLRHPPGYFRLAPAGVLHHGKGHVLSYRHGNHRQGRALKQVAGFEAEFPPVVVGLKPDEIQAGDLDGAADPEN